MNVHLHSFTATVVCTQCESESERYSNAATGRNGRCGESGSAVGHTNIESVALAHVFAADRVSGKKQPLEPFGEKQPLEPFAFDIQGDAVRVELWSDPRQFAG